MIIGVWSNVLGKKSSDFDLILKKTKWDHTANKFQGASSHIKFILQARLDIK